jgi:hypothetical protein
MIGIPPPRSARTAGRHPPGDRAGRLKTSGLLDERGVDIRSYLLVRRCYARCTRSCSTWFTFRV